MFDFGDGLPEPELEADHRVQLVNELERRIEHPSHGGAVDDPVGFEPAAE